jgi:hypothetical protein
MHCAFVDCPNAQFTTDMNLFHGLPAHGTGNGLAGPGGGIGRKSGTAQKSGSFLIRLAMDRLSRMVKNRVSHDMALCYVWRFAMPYALPYRALDRPDLQASAARRSGVACRRSDSRRLPRESSLRGTGRMGSPWRLQPPVPTISSRRSPTSGSPGSIGSRPVSPPPWPATSSGTTPTRFPRSAWPPSVP